MIACQGNEFGGVSQASLRNPELAFALGRLPQGHDAVKACFCETFEYFQKFIFLSAPRMSCEALPRSHVLP